MDSANLPAWIQEVTIIAVASVSIIVGVWRYLKTESGKTTSPKQANTQEIVAASFIDSRKLAELTDALREHQDESARIALRITRSQHELREAILENTEASRLQADATLNMIKFIKRQNAIGD